MDASKGTGTAFNGGDWCLFIFETNQGNQHHD